MGSYGVESSKRRASELDEKRDSKQSKRKSKKSRRDDKHSGPEDNDHEDYSQYSKARYGKPVLTEDDYFAKSTEFQTWLRIDKKKYFNDLSGRSAREYFVKFAKRWNKGKLEKRYYDGIVSSDVPAAERTRHQWKFKNIDESEMLTAQDSVHALTQSSEQFARPLTREEQKNRAEAEARPRTGLEKDEELDRAERSRLMKRKEHRDSRKHHEMVLDELVPKATGREAQLEKKRATNQYHRQERDLDVEIPDSDLMGTNSGPTGDSSLAAYKRVQERRDERRNMARDEKAQAMAGKVSAYQAKEDQTLAMFKQMAQSRFGGSG
ncbi:hypothetical protein DFJ77DRAFT_457918 [Powellomyces hirtus]|nr:hypothetical protein DFJ77DRAFT_457918 [Powellomyces hirtus]